jgi:hypothetical protein
MIIAEVFYGIKCDICDEICEDSEHSFYSDEGDALENSFNNEWAELNGKHYCPNCYSIDEETEGVKPFSPFPDHVKTIRKFFSSMVRSMRESIDESKEGVITLTYSIMHNESVYSHEEAFIRDFLKDSLIDLVQSKEKNHQPQISISIKL